MKLLRSEPFSLDGSFARWPPLIVLGPDNSDYRRFEVALHFSGKRVNRPLDGDSVLIRSGLDIRLKVHLYLNGCVIKEIFNYSVSSNKTFRALADPTRREILALLRHGEITAGVLAEKFDMTKPAMSHHFAVLKDADLITSRREGQQIWYGLNTTVVQDLMAWAMHLIEDSKKSRRKQG